jgi:hypothetical protein
MNHDSIGSRLVALIVKPGQAMTWVGERPQWLVAAVLVMLLVGVFSALVSHISGPEQLELMRDTRFGRMMSEEDYQAQYEEALAPSPGKRVINGLSAAIGIAIVSIIYGVVYLLFAKLAGGAVTFKQALGITFWASLIPQGLGSIIKLPIVLAKGSLLEASIGLAALAPGADLLSFQYQFLMYFGDFLSWWGLAVTVIGFQKVCGFSGGKATVVVVVPWLVLSGLLFGLGRLFI